MPRRGLVLAVLLPALLAGCTAGPSKRPPVVENDEPVSSAPASSATAVPLPPLTEPRSPSVDWTDCDQQTRARLGADAPTYLRFSCGTVLSTLDDPALPGRVQTHVALLKAGNGAIPLVVVNDVGGEPGTLYAARLAATLPPALLQRYSLIGVDRRGTGESDPLSCVPEDTRSQLLGQDPADDDLEPLLDAARKAGQQCAIDLGGAQQSFDSWRTAGDLDEIRGELGVPKLHALAHGEGSQVLISYAARFPDRVGRFVMDGVPDPSGDTVTVLGDLAAAQQATLDAYGTTVGQDAAATVNAVVDRLRRSPQVLPGGSVFGAGTALRAVVTGLADRTRWRELAQALEAGRAGDVRALAAFVAPMLNGSDVAPSRLDGQLATECNDTVVRMPADQVAGLTSRLRARYPVFGGLVTQQLAWCLPWPARTESLPTLSTSGLPPILVTSTLADPVTPEAGTVRAVQQMPSAVRVAWQGAGHGALSSPCAAEAVRAFLVDGKVPTDGTLCPA
ncbi:alpha/beta hydrolase [Amycolatopsis thermophila]|uniref:Pimeloyl-ACP methyl ester carboxylesterase n=1 Tax=Amycolatopsis thermophila TaxID=206084 RepID=A0ABU0EZM5_9PSEU|nr:alpha/beta fold hydrolase [Amycolatopsis thermophila]MDQ0380257.1 pimeloyl-ACP methyl ester carboxylesterase [Amycolatopsis thermophila]